MNLSIDRPDEGDAHMHVGDNFGASNGLGKKNRTIHSLGLSESPKEEVSWDNDCMLTLVQTIGLYNAYKLRTFTSMCMNSSLSLWFS